MDERDEIEKEIERRIVEKFEINRFCINNIGANFKDRKHYNENLAIFHYIFSIGDIGKTFLWNNYIYWEMSPSDFCEEVFSKEEMDFFLSIEETKRKTIEKYGLCSKDININKPVETQRLILKAFDENTSKEYDDCFYHNKDEFEDYYKHEYKNEFENCYMQFRPLMFAIFLKDSNELIGSIGLNNRNDALYNVEYFIKSDYRRNGYALEAVNELIFRVKGKSLSVLSDTVRDCVFEVVCPDIRCLMIRNDIENIASQRIAEKVGFKKAGTLLFSFLFKNKYYDENVYYLQLSSNKKESKNNS